MNDTDAPGILLLRAQTWFNPPQSGIILIALNLRVILLRMEIYEATVSLIIINDINSANRI